jgi:hypothetical protein
VTSRRLTIAAGIGVVVGLIWLLFVALPRWSAQPEGTGNPVSSAAATPDGGGVRKIKARLFYVTEDGLQLQGVEREVPFAESPAEQAREILNAQLAPVEAPLVSAVPAGTTLRAIFVTPQGQAYVDLSHDISTAHPGGTLNELLTIYTVVHALTINLPAITSVQILVDGKEVDTLAGHVDLRQPLVQNMPLTAGN